MVDFQSRDTRRGLGRRDDDDEEEEDGAEESTDESGGAASNAEGTGEPTDDEQDRADEAGTEQSNETAAEETEAEQSAPDDETPAEQSEETEQSAPDDETTAEQSEEAAVGEAGTAAPGQRADPLAAEADDHAEPAGRPDQRDGPSSTASPAQSGPVGSKSAPPRQDVPTQSASRSASVDVAVVTVGTAGDESDPTGEKIIAALERAGHAVTARERLRGDFDGVQQSVDALVGRDDVDVVVTAGGTGIRADEVAIEAVHPLLEKALPGFGEAFRTLLFEHIGTGIVAVRTTAGVAKSTPVFCLPGDQEAAALGVEEIVAAEAGELVAHLRDE